MKEILKYYFFFFFILSLPYFLSSKNTKYNFFTLPAGNVTKPHQTGMLRSAKLPWFNILSLLSNFSKAENTFNFKEWRKDKKRSENTLHSRQHPSYCILKEKQEKKYETEYGKTFFFKVHGSLLCNGFSTEVKGNW